jgi:hypothetical protein
MAPGSLLTLWLFVALPLLPSSEVTTSDLIRSGDEWAGEEVTVEGELVGDYGFRDDGWMWTQLNGDPYVTEPIAQGGPAVGGNSGIGIRMPATLGEGLDAPGRYGARGPIIRATGVWKWHDPERHGESYLEVESYEVVERGSHLEHEADWRTIAVGTILIVLVPALWPRHSDVEHQAGHE